MKDKNRDAMPRFSKAKTDLVLLVILGIAVFALSALFNVSEKLSRLLDAYEYLQLDEVFVVAVIFVVGFAIFAARRWQELDRENAERRKAEEALTRANKKLSLLNSVTRHDIINQLTVLRGYLKQSLKIPQTEQGTNFIAKELAVAERISRQILFTKEYQDIGLQVPVWQNAGEVIRRARDAHGMIPVTISEALGTYEVYADRLLENVFFNLIENALRHGGDGIGSVHFSAHEDGDQLLIVCEDDGEGILTDDKGLIFDAGYGKNTGYGLFLAREILSITGITIRETGEYGRGARFEILVPLGDYRHAVPGAV